MSDEIELKLSLPPAALAKLRRHAVFATAPKQGNATTLDNTYFDTPELALKRRGVGLRIRRQGRLELQTVKSAAASVGGLSARPEWEQPFAGEFDFSAVDAPKVRKLLERHAGELVPVFTTRFRRDTRLHTADSGARILMMIDTGDVIAGERRTPLCELELELVEGSPQALLRLARALAHDVPMWPSDVSKAERGYRLHLDSRPAPAGATASEVRAEQTPVDAFRSLASACVRQWQANAAGAADDGDPEFVHQLRVALRRLRSMLALFEPALPPAFVAEWRARLEENADRFAAPRDLDVLHDEILAPVVRDAARGDDGLARLLGLARAARDDARSAVLARLDPAEQGRLLIDFTAALHELPPEPSHAPADLHGFAAERLDRLRRRARKRLEAAGNGAPERLHALRIAIKRLRYAVESFAPLMPSKPAARHLRRLAKAQGALGFVNDVEVARMRCAGWADGDAALAAAAGFVAGWQGRRAKKLAARTLRELGSLLQDRAPWRA